MTLRPVTLSLLALMVPSLAAAQSWPDLGGPGGVQGGGQNDAAVIVGIEHYPFVAPVPGATHNADDWHVFLTKTRQVPLSHVQLLRDSDGSLEQMRSEVQRAAASVKPGGTLWFIFIGHGAPASDGSDGLLVGVDAQQRADSIAARSLPQKQLLDLLNQGKQAHTVVVLDACFSGRTSSGQELVKGLQPLIPVKQAARATKAMVFTAARSDQFAGPLPQTERPAFSYLMLGALRGWADKDGDGKVSAQEAIDYVQEALLALIKDRTQTPGFDGPSGQDLLSNGAKEKGPDLGAMVRGSSEVSFGGTASVSVPKINVTSVSSFKDINVKAEQLLEKAQDTDASKTATPAEKAGAWCALASLTDRNPYLDTAKQGCTQWHTYADALAKLEGQVADDYATLSGYLALKRKTPQQKLAAVDAFLGTYGGLNGNERVKSVQAVRKDVEAGKEVKLEEPQHAASTSFASAGQPFGACPTPDTKALQKQCQGGKAASCVNLGQIFEAGEGVTKDLGRAAALYELACSKKNVRGCTTGATLYFSDNELKNEKRGLDLMKAGCDLNDAQMCTGAASTLLYNDKLKDLSAGIPLATRLCEQRNWMMCVALGGLYLIGTDVPKDLAKAQSLYERACSNDYAQGCMSLGTMFVNDDPVKAEGILRRGCEQLKDKSNCSMLQVALDAEKRLAEAKQKADEKAAELAQWRAQASADDSRAASMCQPEEAKCHFVYDACVKDAKKCGMLAGSFVYGQQGLPKNKALGITYYTKACNAGDFSGCQSLAGALFSGEGTEVNKVEATRLMRPYCEQLNPYACSMMGNTGTDEEKEWAKKKMDAACDKGDDTACIYSGKKKL